jgi:hypothetical protein
MEVATADAAAVRLARRMAQIARSICGRFSAVDNILTKSEPKAKPK